MSDHKIILGGFTDEPTQNYFNFALSLTPSLLNQLTSFVSKRGDQLEGKLTMGTDMTVLGGMISFADLTTTAVDTVKTGLDQHYAQKEQYRTADYSAARSWDDLFADFKLGLAPTDRGLYTVIGLNDTYYDPADLLTEAAKYVTDNSWLVWSEGATYSLWVATFKNGEVTVKMISDEGREDNTAEPKFLYYVNRHGHQQALGFAFEQAKEENPASFTPGELPRWVLDDEKVDPVTFETNWFISWDKRYGAGRYFDAA